MGYSKRNQLKALLAAASSSSCWHLLFCAFFTRTKADIMEERTQPFHIGHHHWTHNILLHPFCHFCSTKKEVEGESFTWLRYCRNAFYRLCKNDTFTKAVCITRNNSQIRLSSKIIVEIIATSTVLLLLLFVASSSCSAVIIIMQSFIPLCAAGAGPPS